MNRITPLLLLALAGCEVESAQPLLAEPAASQRICPDSPYNTIQEAINAAASGSTITICNGTFVERITLSGKNVTLQSQNGVPNTVIDGGLGGSVVKVSSGGTLTLRGMTITRGSTSDGGGVRCTSANLVVDRSRIIGNKASRGGGIAASGCGVTISDSEFVQNSTTDTGDGGGLWFNGSHGSVTGSSIADNYAYRGGGAFVINYTGVFDGNDVEGNESIEDGGGLFVDHGAPTVRNNLFADNRAGDDGGGLRTKVAGGSVVDNTFVGNYTPSEGGGAKLSHDDLYVAGNSFVDNESGWHGGGLVLDESSSDVVDNEFVGNHSQNGGGLYVHLGWDPVEVEDSTFEANSASLRGGHVFIEDTIATAPETEPDAPSYFTRVDFIDGSAREGGAIYSDIGEVHLNSVLLDHNVATSGGGALFLLGSTGSMDNSVLYTNQAPWAAGVVVINGLPFAIRNTVFYKNTGGKAIVHHSGTVATVKYSDFYGNTANFSGMADVSAINGNRTSYPGFVTASGGDFHLAAGSALIDKGDPALLDANGTRSDIGIYGGPYGW